MLSAGAQPKAANVTRARAQTLDSVASVSISSTPLNAAARPVLATPIVSAWYGARDLGSWRDLRSFGRFVRTRGAISS